MGSNSKRVSEAKSSVMRKQPTQDRAQRTIEIIFQATTQIVDKEGEEGLTTNKIARVAGVSVGTLYQYFPTKEAVLQAMIDRERRRVMDEMKVQLMSAVQGKRNPKEVLRERIRILVQAFGIGTKSNRTMVRMAWRLDHHVNIAQAQREAAEHIAVSLAQIKHRSLRAPNPAMVFIVTRAVLGVIRSASLENSPLLGTPEFEEELVRMAWGLMRT